MLMYLETYKIINPTNVKLSKSNEKKIKKILREGAGEVVQQKGHLLCMWPTWVQFLASLMIPRAATVVIPEYRAKSNP